MAGPVPAIHASLFHHQQEVRPLEQRNFEPHPNTFSSSRLSCANRGELAMAMVTPRPNLILTVAQVLIACLFTVGLLELARFFGGSAAVWSVGMLLLLLAAIGLLRLRK
jgi:hypothetical protein